MPQLDSLMDQKPAECLVGEGPPHRRGSLSSRSFTFLLSVFAMSIPFYGFSFFNYKEVAIGRPDWVIGGLLVLVFLIGCLQGQLKLRRHRLAVCVLAFNVIAVTSILGLSHVQGDYFREYLTYAGQILLMSLMFFAVSQAPVSDRQLSVVVKVWALTACLVSVYGIYQVFARNLGLPLAYLTLSNPSVAQGGMRAGTFGEYTRVSSILREPAYLGAYLMGPMTLLGSCVLLRCDRRVLFSRRILNWCALGVVGVSVVLSFALSAYVTIAILLPIMLLNRRIRRRALRVTVPVAGFILIVILILGAAEIQFSTVTERFDRFTESLGDQGLEGVSRQSIGVRLANVVTGLSIWAEHPLIGVGLNNFQFHALSHSPKWYTYLPEKLERSHNVWISALAEMGIIGFAALLCLWGTAFWTLWKAARLQSTEEGYVLQAFAYLILVNAIGGTFTLPIIHPVRWFSLGISMLALSRYNRQRSAGKES
jgi:O-antigen ligase